MAVHTIKKGLDLPIVGDPKQEISNAPAPRRVAVLADDFVGMKPRVAVKVGDAVKRGQLLFEDRKAEGVRHTSPGAGKVVAINRGQYRAFQSLVIELSDGERSGKPSDDELQSFESYTKAPADKLSREQVVALLTESGLWTALRQRPFGTVPKPGGDAPYAVFVTAMDSNPHAPKLDAIVRAEQSAFEAGLTCVQQLSGGKTYLCRAAGSSISAGSVSGVDVEEFAGPHPAGNVGYHVHILAPVSRTRTVWHIGAQDVIAIGKLVGDGKLDVQRVVSLAGPSVQNPRLLKTRIGAELSTLVEGELRDEAGDRRIISGSVLQGRTAKCEIFGYLGRHHQQVSALREGTEREFLGWLTPGADRFSTANIYVSKLNPGRKFAFTTTTNGSRRAIVPIGQYEKVFPFDILPTFLLRSLMVNDLETAEELGMLELEPEDLDLCTFVCPGKQDFGPALRENLETVRSEG